MEDTFINHRFEPVVIIGAGPAGLTAAYELDKLGQKSLILESDDQVGGISRTVTYNDYRFDIGGHRFYSKVPYVNQLWQEILGDDFLERPRLSRIYYRGHFFDYPLKALNALSGLGYIEAVRVMLSYLKSQLFPHPDEGNFEQWVSNRFGHRLFNIFFKTYTEKVWGIPCNEISADWAAQRIKNLSLKEALRNALLSGNTGGDGIITTLIERFHYPRLGPGMMWERCEQLLATSGIPTRMGEKVYRISHGNGHVERIYAKNDAGEVSEYSAPHFVSTMPLRSLIRSLDPPPPPAVLDAASRLRYRDFLTVVLILDREDVFPDNWIYIHSPEVKLGRVQNYKNWSPEMVPDSSRTSLGLEYFLWEKDPEWGWPDKQLIELGVRECAQIGLIHPKEVLDGTVVRMKKAYPIYDHHYHNSLEIIRDYLATFQNLQTIGRNGLHRYNNQDHSMMTGVYAARNIAGAQKNVWAVNTEKAYHESGDGSVAGSGERLIPERIAEAESKTDLTRPVKPADADIKHIVEDFFARIDPVALGLAMGIVSGISLFLLTALVVLKGDSAIAPKLSLLSHFFLGFQTSWPGAIIGLAEGMIGGFLVGNIIAGLRNWAVAKYARLVRNRVETVENQDLLDKIR